MFIKRTDIFRSVVILIDSQSKEGFISSIGEDVATVVTDDATVYTVNRKNGESAQNGMQFTLMFTF